MGNECAFVHVDGPDGAGFARCTRKGVFKAVIHLTCRELNRIAIAGDGVNMKNMFAATADLPRIVLPGGRKFFAFGPLQTLAKARGVRPSGSTRTASCT